jgi:hypothetical protein
MSRKFEFTYSWKEVVLYALGIGAQVNELPFLYENTPGGLQVFPSHGLCGGEVTRFKEFKARFSNVVYPGETLTTEGWRESTGRYILRARTERAVVLSNAYAVVAS